MKSMIFFCLLAMSVYSQSNLDKIIKGGEIVITGLTFLKDKKSVGTDGIIDKICIRNKLTENITLNLFSTDIEKTLSKSLVIPKDGKECLLEIPTGIYMYEIVLHNKEVYKRGEYRFEESTTITVRK